MSITKDELLAKLRVALTAIRDGDLFPDVLDFLGDAQSYAHGALSLYDQLEPAPLTFDTCVFSTPRDEWPEDAASAVGHLLGLMISTTGINDEVRHCSKLIVDALTAAENLSEKIPAGWAIVPIEPTEAMVRAAWVRSSLEHCTYADAYSAMIAAVPQYEAPGSTGLYEELPDCAAGHDEDAK